MKLYQPLAGAVYFDLFAPTDNSIYKLHFVIKEKEINMSEDINVSQILETLNKKVDLDQKNTNEEGLAYGSGWGMPSDRYIELSLGSSGSRYVAPANGWYFLRKWSTKDPSYLEICNITSLIIDTQFKYGTVNMQYCVWVPVNKNDIIQTNYTFNGDTSIFVFVYSTGSKS